MGGDMLVGIRRRNGEVHLATRWTNPTSWWFNNPEMYDPDEKLLKKYLKLAEQPRPEKEIHPSEYGVLLYDAQKARVLSCQCYSAIGSTLVSLSDREMMELAQATHQRGLVTGLRVYPLGGGWDNSPWGPKPEEGPIHAPIEKFPRFFEIIKKTLADGWPGMKGPGDEEYAMFQVDWQIPGLEVVHLGGLHGYNRWPEVLKWVAENEWPVPIWTQEQVDRQYKDPEEEADEDEG